ncbi:MAG: hypothetical protein NC038_06780 [Paludibacter sp.]|nr:hypothetical protein [Bacteroidales bacterium]MCM1354251.1 hypothetical protein [Bacteroides sp.]MCM1403451.1 hypothetical protein [Bacteroides sp.]MCM1482325.1 hypothetical protein [Paludibacter sp.]MCM1576650.1 hypothetical protein [Bacteroides sp.]
MIRRIGKTRIGYYLNILIYKLFNRDLQRTLCLRFLRGYSKTELEEKAELFYQQLLVPLKIMPVWNVLPQQNLVLVSGTLDIIASVVATHTGAIGYHSSELEYENGYCTGRLRNDFLKQKSSISHLYPQYDVITDNLSDIALVSHAEKAYIVVYQNQNRWNKQTHYLQNITYIHATGTTY